MRKRGPLDNKATKAAQRIEYPEPEEPKRKARPRGRSVGGPWIRK